MFSRDCSQSTRPIVLAEILLVPSAKEFFMYQMYVTSFGGYGGTYASVVTAPGGFLNASTGQQVYPVW